MKPSNPHHIYYISDDELTPEIKIKLREISSRKHSNYKIAFASILAALITVVGAFVIRHFELQTINGGSGGNTEIELMLRLENIERTVIETRKTVQTDHKLANNVVFRVNKLYCKEFPDQCLNAFGNYNKKGK